MLEAADLPVSLALNTNCVLNRLAEPEELVRAVAEDIGMRRIQLTADMLSPDLPGSVIADQVRRYNKACAAHGVSITTTFTGAYTRLNHMAHPDAAVRQHWIAWFKRLVDITADLGARSTGSQIGVLTYRDNNDPARRAERLQQALDGWYSVAAHAADRGLPYMMWEPMSISREFGETIAECRRLNEEINRRSPLPFKLNSDIDHGDVTSPNPRDYDPYAWLEEFCQESGVIHIKQSSANKGGHWPFTAQFNDRGRITPERVLSVLKAKSCDDAELVFEFTFREREPTDSSALAALRESADYWRPYVSV